MPPVDAFIRQSGAVLAHDATDILGSIQAPTLITFGRHDIVTSTRFAAPLTEGIANTELIVFEDCAHAADLRERRGVQRRRRWTSCNGTAADAAGGVWRNLPADLTRS